MDPATTELLAAGYVQAGKRDLDENERYMLRCEAISRLVVGVLLWVAAPISLLAMLIALTLLEDVFGHSLSMVIAFPLLIAVVWVVFQAHIQTRRSRNLMRDIRGGQVSIFQFAPQEPLDAEIWQGDNVIRMELLPRAQRIWTVNRQQARYGWVYGWDVMN